MYVVDEITNRAGNTSNGICFKEVNVRTFVEMSPREFAQMGFEVISGAHPYLKEENKDRKRWTVRLEGTTMLFIITDEYVEESYPVTVGDKAMYVSTPKLRPKDNRIVIESFNHEQGSKLASILDTCFERRGMGNEPE